MGERNIFSVLEVSNNLLGQEEYYEAELGTDTDEEEGNYNFLEAVNQSLAAEELSSDEEYVLTELGPVIRRLEESEAAVTSSDGQHAPDEMVDSDRSAPDVQQVLDDLQEDIAIPIHLAAKDGIVWSVQPGAVNKTPSKNIFRPPVRKFVNCQTMIDPVSAYGLLFTPTMIRDIVKYTNIEGRRVQQHRWIDTDYIEIQAFIGLLIYLGALNQNIFPTELIWDARNGNTLARSVMSRSRFLALSNRLRFDNKETRSERRNQDEFAPIRDIWEQLLSNMRRHYAPGPFITVDEQLIPWRGRCKFIQYIPSKPDKYGLKVFWACDAETNYPLVSKPYLGKIGLTPQVNLGRNVAIELCKPFFGSGRNLTVDNFFTDLELCDILERHKMTVVGTVRRNKRFLPEEFKDPKKTEKKQAKFAFRKGKTLVSYKSGIKKNVILVSTMHHDASIVNSSSSTGNGQKPEIVQFYNSTKGGVDCMDLMAHSMTTKRQTKRWPMVFFFNMLDLASIAAIVLFKLKFPDHRLAKPDYRRFFQIEIARSLVYGQLCRRLATSNLPRQLVNTIQQQLGTESMEPATVSEVGGQGRESENGKKKRKRCGRCPAKKDLKTSDTCDKCGIPICKNHALKKVSKICTVCNV